MTTPASTLLDRAGEFPILLQHAAAAGRWHRSNPRMNAEEHFIHRHGRQIAQGSAFRLGHTAGLVGNDAQGAELLAAPE